MNILDYIKGQRKGKEAHRLEKEAMNDPFLSDALEGFENVKGDHAQRIEDMRAKLPRPEKQQFNYLRMAGIAAGILLFVGIGCVAFLYNKPSPDRQLVAQAEKQPDTTEQVVEIDIPDIEPDEKTDLLIAETTKEKPETARPVPEISGQHSDIQAIEDVKESFAFEDELIIDERLQDSGVSDLQAEASKQAEADEEISQILITARQDPNFSRTAEFDKPKDQRIATSKLIRPDSSSSKTTAETKKEACDILAKPIPVGGYDAYKQYIKDNLKRPDMTDCKKTTGKVTLVFMINSQGRPYNVRVERSLCPPADEEAIRLIEEGPAWTLGSRQVEWTVEF